jgi:hypothetical protein
MVSALYDSIFKYVVISIEVVLLFYVLKIIFERLALFFKPVFCWVVGAIIGVAIFVLLYDSVDKKLFFLYFTSLKWAFLGLSIYSLVRLKDQCAKNGKMKKNGERFI